MASLDTPLSERQLSVLRWVVEGSPEGVMIGNTHKTVAVGLQNRRLVSVNRRRGAWSATVTDAGRHVVEHGSYPDGHFPPRLRQEVPITEASEVVRSPVVDETGRRQPRRTQAVRMPPTAQFVAELLAAGGELITGTERPRRDYDALIGQALRVDKVPEGKLLVRDRGRTWSDPSTIRLLDAPPVLGDSVPVPHQLRLLHLVVAGLRDDERGFQMTKSVRGRALRIMQGLAQEAERRGHGVASPRAVIDGRREEQAHLTITVGNLSYGVRLVQEIDRAPHEPTATEQRALERGRYVYLAKWDETPSPRLRMSLTDGVPYRQSSWSDGKRSVDSHLGAVMREIEVRAALAERERQRKQAEQARRQTLWEAAMEKAQERFADAHRTETLIAQADNWAQAQRLTAYVVAMEKRTEELLDSEERATAQEWLTWSRERAHRMNPLNRPLSIPIPPEPKPEDLTPFLDSWSPYGPGSASRW